MKTTTYFFMVFVSLISCKGHTYAQSNDMDKQSMQMLKEFYTSYSAVQFTVKNLGKIDSLQKKYCTVILRKELKKEFQKNGLDHDLLTNDYGIEADGLKTLSVAKDPVKSNAYNVSYTDHTTLGYKPVEIHVVIHVTVVKENGALKIASIN